MNKILISGVVAAALLWLLPASSLGADLEDLPQCSNGEPNALGVSGVPRPYVAGKPVELELSDDGYDRDTAIPFRVEQILNEKVIDAAVLSRRRFEVEPPRPGTFVVAISYALREHDDASYSVKLPPCRKTETSTREVVAPLEQRVSVKVREWYDSSVEFEILTRAEGANDCDYAYARAPLTLRVWQVGSRWRTIASADNACTGWSYIERPRILGDDGDFDVFEAGWPRKRSTSRSYRYVVRENRHGRVLASGALRARQVYHRAERVYAWLPGLVANDRYWNYCVKNGEEISMAGGNAYCIEGGYTSTDLSLTRSAVERSFAAKIVSR